jgi:hypothetical protein
MVTLSGVVAGSSPVMDGIWGVVDHNPSRADIWDVTEGAKVEHPLQDFVQELFYLFAYVVEESVAQPSAHKHDWVDRDFPQIHLHRCPGAKGVCSYLVGFEAEGFATNCRACCSQVLNYSVACDVFYPPVPPD